MNQGFFITGTDTGVGKTLIAAALIERFVQSGLATVGMKPIAAGARMVDRQMMNEDVEQLIAASNVDAPLMHINPYVFEPAIAPHIAAKQAGIDVSMDRIITAFHALSECADLVVVEGAGGFLVPLNDTEDMADLASALALPVILVVGMRLGCLNHTLLTVASIKSKGLQLAGWVANGVQPAMENFDDNLQSLKQRIPAPCLGVIPWSEAINYQQAAGYLQLPTNG